MESCSVIEELLCRHMMTLYKNVILGTMDQKTPFLVSQSVMTLLVRFEEQRIPCEIGH